MGQVQVKLSIESIRIFSYTLLVILFANCLYAQQGLLTLNMSDSSFYKATDAYADPAGLRFGFELLDTLENQDSFTGKVVFNLKTVVFQR